MAVTDNYDFWNLDPAEAMSDFPSTWNWNIDKIDAAIHDAATAPVSLSRLPNLPASKTTSGTFADARIPSTIARSADVTAAIDDATTKEIVPSRLPLATTQNRGAVSPADRTLLDSASFSSSAPVFSLVQRASGGQISVPTPPVESYHASSKSYVDDENAALDSRIRKLEDANRTTGARDISDLLITENGWTGSNTRLQLIRTGSIVTVVISGIMRAEDGSGWTDVAHLPNGFRPTYNLYTLTNRSTWVGCKYSGEVISNSPPTPLDYFYFTFVTANEWPTTLPGTPA